jgi:hypothetical protein
MIYPTDFIHPSSAPHFKTFQIFLQKEEDASNRKELKPESTLQFTTIIESFLLRWCS